MLRDPCIRAPRLISTCLWFMCACVRAPCVRACSMRACVLRACVLRACVLRACVRACSVRACSVLRACVLRACVLHACVLRVYAPCVRPSPPPPPPPPLNIRVCVRAFFRGKAFSHHVCCDVLRVFAAFFCVVLRIRTMLRFAHRLLHYAMFCTAFLRFVVLLHSVFAMC